MRDTRGSLLAYLQYVYAPCCFALYEDFEPCLCKRHLCVRAGWWSISQTVGSILLAKDSESRGY